MQNPSMAKDKGSFSMSALFLILFLVLFIFLFFSGMYLMSIKTDKTLLAAIYSEIGITKHNEKGIGFAEKNILEKRIMANKLQVGENSLEVPGLLKNMSLLRLVYTDKVELKQVVFSE
ncbi:MAG: hypothetical protein PHH82_04470 [Candidatus ainarchaeum sp.]|nr:hypothetical protein [Candidatus ainarchaeum sp.]